MSKPGLIKAGEMIKKMISTTNITSTKGIILISDMTSSSLSARFCIIYPLVVFWGEEPSAALAGFLAAEKWSWL